VEAVRVLIEKGALIEAAQEVRIHPQQPHMRAHNPSYTHACTLWPASAAYEGNVEIALVLLKYKKPGGYQRGICV
jgi:hypothetical protein